MIYGSAYPENAIDRFHTLPYKNSDSSSALYCVFLRLRNQIWDSNANPNYIPIGNVPTYLWSRVVRGRARKNTNPLDYPWYLLRSAIINNWKLVCQKSYNQWINDPSIDFMNNSLISFCRFVLSCLFVWLLNCIPPLHPFASTPHIYLNYFKNHHEITWIFSISPVCLCLKKF